MSQPLETSPALRGRAGARGRRAQHPSSPGDPSTLVTRLLKEAHLNVTTETFLDDVRDALQSIHRSGAMLDPASQLTTTEAGILDAGGFDLVPPHGPEDPISAAAAAFTALLASSIDVAAASRLLEVSPTRIRQMLGQRTLYGIRTGPNWRLPAFQFSDRGVIPGLSAVVRCLPVDLHPLAVERWLTAPSPDLELDGRPVSPLAWLRSGADPSRVADIAAEL